jgi:hypothetical protein
MLQQTATMADTGPAFLHLPTTTLYFYRPEECTTWNTSEPESETQQKMLRRKRVLARYQKTRLELGPVDSTVSFRLP